ASRKPEEAIFPALRELGISATLYSVFSRGLLTGSKAGAPGDFRTHLPRFSGENQKQNQAVVARLASLAGELRRTPGQLLLGWVLLRQPGFVPVVGAMRPSQILDALGVLERPLSAGEAAAVEATLAEQNIAGERYGADQMRHLDSER